MTATRDARELARAWIEGWNHGQPDDLPLAPEFTHTSPFGVFEGRERYLAWIKPMAEQNVTSLEVVDTLGGPDQAVIRFRMATPSGSVEVCDWVQARDGLIIAITSFYHDVEIIADQVRQARESGST